MKLRGIVAEDFLNYKDPAMILLWPNCNFKCDLENGNQFCQNLPLIKTPIVETDPDVLIDEFINNPITKAIVCSGLEPMDSFDELLDFIKRLREKSDAMVVIYTGYKATEIKSQINKLKKYPNIIVKFGRYKPNEEAHFDELLGIKLASKNQWAKQIS